jgi:hypothetical protein
MSALDDYRREREAHGWDDAYFERLLAEDPPPPPPAGAMELLRALNCPIFPRRRELGKAS